MDRPQDDFDDAARARLVGPVHHHARSFRPTATYVALVLYTAYSFVIYILSIRRSALLPQRILHWLDLVLYMPLIAVTGGSNSMFFFFLFFSILVASFGWGFIEGVRMTLVTASLFTIVSVLFPAEQTIELSQVPPSSNFPACVGLHDRSLGRFRSKTKESPRALERYFRFLDPRFGLDPTVNRMMDRLRHFYKADSCLAVVQIPGGTFQLRKVSAATASGWVVKTIPDQMATILLSPSPPAALIFHERKSKRLIYDIRNVVLRATFPPLLTLLEIRWKHSNSCQSRSITRARP